MTCTLRVVVDDCLNNLLRYYLLNIIPNNFIILGHVIEFPFYECLEFVVTISATIVISITKSCVILFFPPPYHHHHRSAFMFYSKAKRPHLRAQNMTLRVGQLAQILAAQWKIMTPSEKKQFDDMARKDKERYEMQLKAYRKGEYIPMSDQQDIDQICNMYQ